MTEEKRVEQLEHVGAVNLYVKVTSGGIEVRATKTDTAEVTLEPVTPGDEVALDLIARTTVTKEGGQFRVRVPKPPNTVTGVQSVYGNGNIVVGNVSGTVISVGDIVGGMTIGRGGVRIGGVAAQGVVIGNAGQVRVTVTVPGESHISAETTSAPMNVYTDADVQLAETVFTSVSGDLTAVGSRRVNAHSVSGDITADGAEWMLANSTSGDIRAESLTGSLNARSISGGVRAHAKADGSVTASSISGDVTVTRDRGVTVTVDAGSVSGRVRT